MTVLDASAVLAYVKGEPGADAVQAELSRSVIGAANLSEVLSKFEGDAEASLVEALLVAQGVTVEPVTREDARQAARLGAERPALSLGDRLCLALAHRRGEPALTADRAWGQGDDATQIR